MGSTSGKRRQAGVLAAILGLSLAGAHGCSQATDGALGGPAGAPDPAPRLRVATSGDYAPESVWPAGEAEPSGHSIDLARAFARAEGREIEWVRFAWPSLAADLANERFDVALSGITIRSDRSRIGRFSAPTATSGAVVLVRAASELAAPADLERAGLRLAVNRGGHLERVARRLFPGARIEAIPENESVPGRLVDEAADAVLTDSLEAQHWQAVLPPTRAIGPLTRDRKAALFPASREALARRFDHWLLAAEARGELARLRARYGLPRAPTADPASALLARLDERFALLPAIAAAKQRSALPILDPAQEARVHAAARNDTRAAAGELGASAPSDDALADFVDALLAASRATQTIAVEAIVSGPARPSDPDEAERARTALDAELRPALAFASERLVWLVVAARADRRREPAGSPNGALPSRAAFAAILAEHAVPEALASRLFGALEVVLRVEPEAGSAPPARPNARAGAQEPRARTEPRDTPPSA